MFDDEPVLTFAKRPPSYARYDLVQSALRRQSALAWNHISGFASAYPSPPMSNPPSPTRQLPGLSFNNTTGAEPIIPPATTAANAATVSAATHIQQHPTAYPTAFGASPYTPQSLYPRSQAPPSSAYTPSGPTSVYGRGDVVGTQYSTQAFGESGSPGLRGGRKSKAHVASACVNCKRAHLSCDVQRPCTRCVAAGKQDTCYDVAHKKRGRPRLRDDSEFRLDRMVPPTTTGAPVVTTALTAPTAPTAPTALTAPMATPSRPIAATRQRRAESFRSIQSMTSEGSSSYGPPTPGYLPQPPVPFQSALTYAQPGQPGNPPQEPEVPTAFLDMNFVILRANGPFQQIMAGGRNLAQQRLTDIAAPADAEIFVTIRDSLRAERDSREPMYLPPILPSGENPVSGVSDADAERFAQGFQDRTYTWTQLQPGRGGLTQTFPARVRLAKAATYFTVVTLPSFRPVIERSPQPMYMPMSYGHSTGQPFAVGPPLPVTDGQAIYPRHSMALSAPPPPQPFPFDSGGYGMQQPSTPAPMPSSRTYPPPQPLLPYQHPYSLYQPGPMSSARPPVTQSPSRAPPYTPIAAPRELGPLPGPARDMQLPPLASSPIAPPLGTTYGMPQAESSTAQDVSSGEDSGGRRHRSPKKRRRMGIDEVLQ